MSPFNCTYTSFTQLLWSVASKAVPLFHIILGGFLASKVSFFSEFIDKQYIPNIFKSSAVGLCEGAKGGALFVCIYLYLS